MVRGNKRQTNCKSKHIELIIKKYPYSLHLQNVVIHFCADKITVKEFLLRVQQF